MCYRELSWIVSIIKNNKKAILNTQTLHLVGNGLALKQHHKFLVSEMKLRVCIDKPPVSLRSKLVYGQSAI